MILSGNEILHKSIDKLHKAYVQYLLTRMFFLFCLSLTLFKVPKNEYFFIISISVLIFSVIILIPYIQAQKNVSNFINEIEINASHIRFKTIEVPLFGSLVKFKRKEFASELNNLSIVLENNNRLSKRFHSDIYALSFKSKKYYVVKDFFDDFNLIAMYFNINK